MSEEIVRRLDEDESVMMPQDGFDLSHLTAQEEMPLRGGVKLHFPTYRSRQDEATDIVARYREDTDKVVRELGKKIHGEWDDYHGASYLHFPGEVLDGLDLRGVMADYTVFTAGSLRGAKLDKASIYASVFTATDLAGASLVNTNARHLVAPFANFENANLRSLKAESAVFNFASFHGARMLGASLVGAYLIGVRGIDSDMAQEASSFEGATILGGANSTESAERIEGHALSSRFTTDQMTTGAVEAKIYESENWTRLLSSASNIEGAFLREISMGRADLTHLQAIGSIWDQVIADEVRLRSSYISGAVIAGSSLNHADTNRAWFPGAVIVGTELDGFRPGNIAGTLFVDSDLSEMDTNLDPDAAAGGSIFVGRDRYRPKIAEGNPLEDDMLQTTLDKLPPHATAVISALRNQNQLTTGAQKQKETAMVAKEDRELGAGEQSS